MLDWLSAWYEKRTARTKKTIVLVAGLSGVSIFYLLGRFVLPLQGPDEGLFTEIVGILITVLLFGRWIAINDQERYKKSLIRQARSRANSNAIDAIETIREEGWLEEEGISLLEGRNLSGADLSGVNLRNAYLLGTQFNDKAKLDGADFSGAYLRNAQFNKAQLNKTIFVSADLAGADFTEAYLYGCVFRASHKEDEKHATLFDKGARPICFIKARIVGLEESGNEIDNHFSDLRLNGATFKDACLANIHFERSNLTRCNFAGASFKNVRFDEAELIESKFVGTQITSISFQQANLSRVDFRHVSFIGVTFNAANLTGAQCTGASFSGSGKNKTDFSDATLHNVIVRDATFDDVIFNGSTIFFDGKKLDDHWSEILEIHWLDTEKKDTTDTDEVIGYIFQQRMEEIARSYGLRSLLSYIPLNVYEKRDGDDDTLELHKLNRFQNIKIEYRASFGNIVLTEDILIEEENY